MASLNGWIQIRLKDDPVSVSEFGGDKRGQHLSMRQEWRFKQRYKQRCEVVAIARAQGI